MDCNFNRVRLCGRISSDPALSHINHGETFYRFVLSVQRLSGQCDDLPVIVPRQLLRACPLGRGDAAAVTGQLRSFNNRSGQGRRLIISVFAQTLERGSGVPCNRIQLGGSLCKPPNYRRTPLGREICDLILAVNRRYGRADYLPCIAWGAVAQQTRSLTVGAPLCLEGRVQSRVYTKNLGTYAEERTAYEVSIMRPAEPEEFLPEPPPEPSADFVRSAKSENFLLTNGGADGIVPSNR